MVGDSYDGGKISGDMTYLYPGFTIGIVGQYQGGHLRAGREAVLVKSCGEKNIKIWILDWSKVWQSWPSSSGPDYSSWLQVHLKRNPTNENQECITSSTLPAFRLLEYEQPGSVTPAKHCQVDDYL